jgi:dipeptidyl aminopeptidase/acylaminoacyl peptidase
MFVRIIGAAILVMGLSASAFAQHSELSVDRIMQAPETWIGAWPSAHSWAIDGSALYFWWNPRGEFPSDSLFKVVRGGTEAVQVSPEERRGPRPTFNGWHHGDHVFDRDFRRMVFTHQGDVYTADVSTGATTRLTQTLANHANARFSMDGQAVIFRRDNQLFRRNLATGLERQLTDLRSGREPSDSELDEQQRFLRDAEDRLIGYIRQQREEREAREEAQERDRDARGLPPTHYLGDRNLQQLAIDPTERFVAFTLAHGQPDSPIAEIHNYITESGYAENIETRWKVGSPVRGADLYIQDLQRDTTFQIDLHQLPGAYDIPEFRRERGETVDTATTQRMMLTSVPRWSGDGRYAILDVRAADNKTRWITRLNPETGDLTVIDRQHDEAWIAGPGIGWWGGGGTLGWLPDNRTIYFQSERTGFSHLYTANVESGEVRALTSGEWEVFSPMLSRDGRTWYFTSSEGSPFERHFYRMPVDGGNRERLTHMVGNNGVALDPREEMLGLLFSEITRPPEIFLQPIPRRNRTAEARRITHSPTEEWLAHDWREGEIIQIPASDGVGVHTQIFRPENPNGAAVFFVHGAGYLQNVHRGWSQYFREYMFHNMLTDLGYTVLNVDFRASAGYGRDWRTAIYRHMGGRDLQDYVDASRYVNEQYGIDPQRVFIYGGSYGGFITMMALFTEAEHFGGGAALRSVTDWAHYNHPYTSNILNLPHEDTLAYTRSSPIYFAEGLEDPLLITHGIVDVNVQFQDVVRLAQRLIELGKEDWEMAVYPVEDHGFTEPESWADQYRRILQYIRLSVGPEDAAIEQVPYLRNRSQRAQP